MPADGMAWGEWALFHDRTVPLQARRAPMILPASFVSSPLNVTRCPTVWRRAPRTLIARLRTAARLPEAAPPDTAAAATHPGASSTRGWVMAAKTRIPHPVPVGMPRGIGAYAFMAHPLAPARFCGGRRNRPAPPRSSMRHCGFLPPCPLLRGCLAVPAAPAGIVPRACSAASTCPLGGSQFFPDPVERVAPPGTAGFCPTELLYAPPVHLHLLWDGRRPPASFTLAYEWTVAFVLHPSPGLS